MNAISIGGMFRTGLTLVIVILLPLLYIIKVKLEDSVESQTAFISDGGDLVPRHRQNHGQPHQDPLAKDNHCHPMAEKIIFLKTHKTASSTVQNVLLRWGQKVGHLKRSFTSLISSE